MVVSALAAALPLPASAVDVAAARGLAPLGDPVGGPALGSAGVVVHYLPGATPLPAVGAASWVLADLTTGEVLAAKAPHKPVRPASTLKTLTSITLMPLLDASAVHTATDAEARAEGSRVGLVPRATYTVDDLWHALLLPSANDAAAALADHNGGFPKTVAQMQAHARALQALDTVVRNPSGLDADGQVTSAYDMALFAREAMNTPQFVDVAQTISYSFPGRPAKAGARRATYQIYSENRLLLHGFPGTVGGKTGYTSLAHRTFWGAVSRGGHTLVLTIFQVAGPTEPAAKAMLTWAFRNRTHLAPVGTLVNPVPPAASPSPAAPSPDPSSVLVTAQGSNRTQVEAGFGGGLLSTLAASTTRSLPWVLLAVLIGVSGVVILALARRRSNAAPDEPPLVPVPRTDVAPPVATPGSSSVVVSTPGRPSAPPAPVLSHVSVSSPSAAPVVAAPEQASGAEAQAPVVVEAAPVVVDALPPATAESPVAVEAAAPAGSEIADAPEDTDATTTTGTERPGSGPTPPAPAAPPAGGHVRVITPPSRPGS